MKILAPPVERSIVLTDGATVAVDSSKGHRFDLSTAASRTLLAPGTGYPGQPLTIRWKNTSGGDITTVLTTGSAGSFRFLSGVTALGATGAGLSDYIVTIYNAADDRWDVVGNTTASNPISDISYDATTWDGNTDAPTKNVVRDKFEALVPGSDTQVIFNDGGLFGGDAGLTYNKTTDLLTINTIPFGKGSGTSSIVIGPSAVASDQNTIAIGNGASSTLDENIAIGFNATSTGTGGSIAIGDSTVATHDSAIAIGSGSQALNEGNLAIGEAAVCNGSSLNAVAVGYFARANEDSAVMIGQQGQVTGPQGIALGAGATVLTGTHSIAIGLDALVNTGHSRSIVIGANAVSTASNQLVIGASTDPITDFYIGEGVRSSTPGNITINSSGGNGTNIVGGTLTLAGGKGTGTGTPGSIIFQTSTLEGTGTTLQTLATRFTISDTLATSTVDIVVPDEVYGGGWNGSFEVPTKNALYDKIETLSGGSPGGSDTQIQFNNAGSFGASAEFIYSSTSRAVELTGAGDTYISIAATGGSGNQAYLLLTANGNQAGVYSDNGILKLYASGSNNIEFLDPINVTQGIASSFIPTSDFSYNLGGSSFGWGGLYLSDASPIYWNNVNLLWNYGSTGIAVGTGSTAGVVASLGNQNLTLRSSNTTTASITVSNGTNAGITLVPHGTGTVASGKFAITSTQATQFSTGYDGSNRLDVAVSSTGSVSFDAVGSAAKFRFLDQPVAVMNQENTTTVPYIGLRNDAFGYGSWGFSKYNSNDLAITKGSGTDSPTTLVAWFEYTNNRFIVNSASDNGANFQVGGSVWVAEGVQTITKTDATSGDYNYLNFYNLQAGYGSWALAKSGLNDFAFLKGASATPSSLMFKLLYTGGTILYYDGSNYLSTTVSATGIVTFDAVGSGAKFVFSDAVEVTDDAYDATGWNGNLSVPTKNALRDKLESMSAGSGISRTVVVTSGSATMGASAATDYCYFVAGAHTMSLPAASGNTNRYTVKNTHSANITIDTAGAENIEGVASISIAPEESVDIVADGTNWFVI